MRLKKTMLLVTAAAVVTAYDNRAGWKKTASGDLETDSDGNPIYIDADGKESPLAPGYVNRINSEARQHRQEAKDAQSKLAAYGDLDPNVAKQAVAKMKDVNLDDLVNKGEIENVRTQMREQFQGEINTREQKLTEAQKRIEALALDNAFNSSTFLKERLVLPEDVVRATFRDRFQYDGEKGRVVPLNGNGEPLINKHGDIASVDEAFQTYIEARTDKDQWLRAADVGGSGSSGAGGGRGGGNRMKRADFDALGPMDKAMVAQRIGKGEVQVVD